MSVVSAVLAVLAVSVVSVVSAVLAVSAVSVVSVVSVRICMQGSLVCQGQKVEDTVGGATQSIHNSNSILKCLQQ